MSKRRKFKKYKKGKKVESKIFRSYRKYEEYISKNKNLVLGILFIIAFSIRMLTYNSIFVGDKIRFLEFDTYYHMRRAVSFTENFPHTWSFDTFIDYPYGSVVGWPPLYDWTIALISKIIGLGNPDIRLIETVGVYLPVILASISVVVIYFLSKEIFGEEKGWKIGLISGLLLAILPAFVQVSFLGFVDHHVAEVLLSSSMFLFFLKGYNADGRDRIKYLSLASFILVLAILTWPGTPIFIGIIVAYIIIQNIVDKRYRTVFVIFGIILISTIIIYTLFPNVYNNLNLGIGFLTRERIELQQVKETQPLFVTFSGKFTLEPSWYAFNTALYIGIVGLILLIINTYRNGLEGRIYRAKLMFLTWTFIVLVLNLYQTRFIYLVAVNLSILCAYLITEIGSSDTGKIAGAILIISILIPSIQMTNNMTKHPLMFSDDWFISLEWLKENTPNPMGINNGNGSNNGNWYTPSKEQIPNYGIMSWWDYGNYILYLSQRPVVANNFQLGAIDSARFLTSENESEANKIMDERNAKYVIVDYRLGLNAIKIDNTIRLRGTWISLVFLVNKDITYYLDRNNLPNQRYFNTTYARLYLFDGKGLENYKLIYKSPTKYPGPFGVPLEEIKIFEYK